MIELRACEYPQYIHSQDLCKPEESGQTQLNVLEYERRSRQPDFSTRELENDARMVRIKNGCELFSHARCSESLFYSIDRPEDIGKSVLKDMKAIEARLDGIATVWAFVPNKSTAYLYPEKQFWNVAAQRFNAPNLLRMTHQAIARKEVDLYPANNTHFSTTGYLLMGEEILKAVRPAGDLPPKSAGEK